LRRLVDRIEDSVLPTAHATDGQAVVHDFLKLLRAYIFWVLKKNADVIYALASDVLFTRVNICLCLFDDGELVHSPTIRLLSPFSQ